MTKVIVWHNGAHYCVTSPAYPDHETEEQTLARVTAKDIPEGVQTVTVEGASIPDDETRTAYLEGLFA
jgi:hypothetical protein